MFTWLKSLFSQPKAIVKMAVDALDFAVPLLAKQIEQARERFLKMTSTEQAQFAIDWVQDHLRKIFKIDPNV